MKKLFSVIVLGLTLSVASIAFSATLVDVPSNHWAEDAVQKLFNSGLVEGYPDGTFKGDRPVTRYEYAMVVARMMEMLDKSYCMKDECKGGAEPTECKCDIDPAQLDEIRDIVKKLAAEFKDELAALKVKVDENATKIASLEDRVDESFLGNLQVSGYIRQRVDVPDSDLSNADFVTNFYGAHYKVDPLLLGGLNDGLTPGYQMDAMLNFDGEAGDNVTFSIGLEQAILNKATIGSGSADAQDLDIDHAYVDVDFSESVRELDALKVRSGYQALWFGPYGMLVDNSGVQSNPGAKLDVAKDLVSVTAYGGLADIDGAGVLDGLGSSGRDSYAAVRLGLDLSFADLGFNYLGTGLMDEKGWGADVVAPLLSDSPFLKELRAEYMTITDMSDGDSPDADEDDASFVVGLDVYKNKRAGVTLSYADIPAVPAYSGVEANPFTEYDSTCPQGLDVSAGTTCYSYDSGRMLFPAGFEGIGVEASYIVLGNVELAASAFVGNYAGGFLGTQDLDGEDFPGVGTFSVTKPINSDSKFRVEYMQQGRDPINLSRVRGELLINF